MKTLIILVFCAIAVQRSWCSGISIIGPKYIRPNRPYTVGLVNPLNKPVKLNLTLQCDTDFRKDHTLLLPRLGGKTHLFHVPNNHPLDGCTFLAINDGGDIMVYHEVDLLIPEKTVSIFIQTDKPVYKPGDVLHFRVVVVDIETKPVTNIKTIQVLIKDSEDKTAIHWTAAKLNMGIFETWYQMAAAPVLGTWTISVTVDDNNISNEKLQSFQVMEYVLPKFAVKAWPTKTLLIEERRISLNVEAFYTFGQHVEGKVQVNLYLDDYSSSPSYKTTKSINGKTVIEFRMDEELAVDDDDLGYVLVNMTAAVTDAFSNATVTIAQMLPVFLKPYKISLVTTSPHYHPGAPYLFKVSVKDHNGLPPEQGKHIRTFVDGEEHSAILDGQGLASFNIIAPEGFGPIDIKAELDFIEYEQIGTIRGSENSNPQYIRVSSKQSIKVGKRVSFSISSNKNIVQFTYFVVTTGGIVAFGHIKNQAKTYTLTIKLDETMAPKATLMVFISRDGSFISDYFDLNFESFGNDFQFKSDEELYAPDQDIYIPGKAQKDSIVFFQAIDQSALLLGHTEYGITKKGILDDLDLYNGEGRDNELDWFNSKGLFYRSNIPADDLGSSRAKRSPLFHPSGKTKGQKIILLRTNFPETWLWRNHSMNNKDKFEIQDRVPDTITSWHVTGFALSPTRGLGIMNFPRKFTVGKPFYMIAHLPYSIKRGEVALIQVTLYNFLGNTVTTDVTLYNKQDEIEFVDQSSKDDSRRTKAIILPSHQVKEMSFLIKAKKLGEIAIKIEAVNFLASDGLEHMLRVTPESRPYKFNEPKFIELPRYKSQSFEIVCNIPRDADPGSTKIKATVDHSLIGLPSKHAESLISIPKDSGDLNLMTLIPNIVALDYLNSTASNAEETVQQKARDSLTKGYENQLKYKSSTGSFRRWIENTGNDSVFLTALVANAFVTASKFIGSVVDQKVVKGAFSWLEGKQNSSGCFNEVGEIIYAPIQNSPIALTAFVVAAIRENSVFDGEYKSLVDAAVNFLADKFYGLSNEYHISLATYALSLTNHPKRKDYIDRLIQNSIKSGSKRYWDAGALSTEIAGYALLTFVAQDLPLQAMDIYDWLNGQRYSSGEFAGVQSTFVGLKALGKTAQILFGTRIDYRVTIKSSIAEDKVPKIWTFDIDQPKSLFPLDQELSDRYRKFQIDIVGTGYGVFQIAYQYHQNIGSISKKDKYFKLETELSSSSTYDVQKLKVSLTYKAPEAYKKSNMVVVEVHLPSGLVVNDYAVRDLSYGEIKNTKREFDGSAMYVYYSSLQDGNVVRFEITAYRKFKIAMHRPAYVVVYDTEETDRFALATYEGKVMQVCDICEDDDCKTLEC